MHYRQKKRGRKEISAGVAEKDWFGMLHSIHRCLAEHELELEKI